MRVSRSLAAVVVALMLLVPMLARAQSKPKEPPLRDVRFEWDEAGRYLNLGLSFRDAIGPEIQSKLQRGLPTTIVFTGALYEAGKKDPVSTTAQSCRITWHVWKEVYLIEITRPGGTRTESTLTINGVLRRCAEVQLGPTARPLPVATSAQVARDVPLFLRAKVQVNPVSAEILQKIKRWVSRPVETATAAPGDALFSTFTGLFLQRIGEAESQLDFTTKQVIPLVPKKR